MKSLALAVFNGVAWLIDAPPDKTTTPREDCRTKPNSFYKGSPHDMFKTAR